MTSQMMANLYTREGDIVWLENVSLPNVTFAKFQPQSVHMLPGDHQSGSIHYAVYVLIQSFITL